MTQSNDNRPPSTRPTGAPQVDPVIDAVANRLIREGQVRSGHKFLVAFSGGADSTALLAACCAIAADHRLDVAAAHVNYHLRDAESDRDEAFCRDLAAQLGVRLHVANVRPPARRTKTWNLQAWARQRRYEIFAQLAREHGYHWVLTAHHADDQIETVTRAFLDGRGSFAMTGIPPRRGNILRPLLDVRSDELRRFLRERQIGWVEDSTNKTGAYRRNEIRHHVIPALSELANGDYPNSVERLTRQLSGWRSYLESEAARAVGKAVLSERDGAIVLDSRRLTGYDKRLTPFVLRDVLRRIGRGEPPTDDAVDRFARLLTEPRDGARYWCGAFRVDRVGGRLVVSCRPVDSGPATRIGEEHDIDLPGWNMKVSCHNNFGVRSLPLRPDNNTEAYFDADAVDGSLTIRNARAGESYRPYGLDGHRTISRAFAEIGVPADWRRHVPVVADQTGVIWPIGTPIAERVSVTPQTRSIRQVKIEWA